MLVQSFFHIEPLVAQITLPKEAIEREVAGGILYILFVTSRNLLVGDGSIRITLTNHAKNCLAVKVWCVTATTSLNMVDGTRGRSDVGITERTRDIKTTVDI